MYPNLEAEIARKRVNHAVLAEAIGMSPCTFSARMTGKRDWTFAEVCKLKKLLGAAMPLEVLFEKDK